MDARTPQTDPDLLSAIGAHPLLAVLDASTRATLVRSGRLVRYRAGRAVLREGDPPAHAYFLLEGAVRVFHRAPKGTELLLKLFRAPALFGEMEVMAGRPFIEHVTTLAPTAILHIPAKVFTRLLTHEHAFAEAVARDLAFRLCVAADNLKALAFEDVDTRLANLLLDYAQFFGEPDGDGVRLAVKLTQERMAADLAITRKALADAMARFKRQGVVRKSGGCYTILDLRDLRSRAADTLRLAFRSDLAIAAR